MKIGILTFHRSYNYGAFMQCYGLSHKLQKDFPNDKIEVIDYVTERMYRNYDTSIKRFLFGLKEEKYSIFTIAKNIVKLFLHPKQLDTRRVLHAAFERDLNCLPLSDYKIISDDRNILYKKIKGNYDIIIVGSDCVWEFLTYPFPNAYFLDDNIGAVKVSYAASSDRMHINNVSEQQKILIKDALSSFAYLGIRDIASQNFLNKIIPDAELKHNCDPTFLLDLDDFVDENDRVRNKLKKAGIDINKPIIGLMCGDNIANRAIKYFGPRYQYVSLYWNNSKADAYLGDLTPREWATVFSFFVLTVTRFFHGTMLSLKNSVPTLTIDEWPMEDEHHISKLEDLYERLNLKDHYCRLSDYMDDSKNTQILSAAESFINNDLEIRKIQVALGKEMESYQEFKNSLQRIKEEYI